MTIWSKSANTEALRENSILVYQSADEYSKDFPELAGLFDFKQLVILPIWARGLPIGSLSLAFNFEFGPIPDGSDDLWIVYQLLGMVLLSPPQWLYSLSQEVGMSPQNSHELSQHLELTDSETRVLTLIGEGLTNKEISARLNYSVSYVGKVNMTLFQKLGAEKRRDAVRVAIARGILREGDTNPEDG